MSFSVRFIDNFESVHDFSLERRRGCKEFIEFLLEIAKVEFNYAKGLEKIGNHPYISSMGGSIYEAIASFKRFSISKAHQAQILAENIVSDIIDPLKEMLKAQENSMKNTSLDGDKITKHKKKLRNHIETLKKNYWEKCKDCENYLMKYEHSTQINHKIHIKRLKGEVLENLKNYDESLDSYYTIEKSYTEKMAKILDDYEAQETTILSMLKNSLKKLTVYNSSCLRNIQYDFDTFVKNSDFIDIENDTILDMNHIQTDRN